MNETVENREKAHSTGARDEETVAYKGWRVALASMIGLAFGPSTILVLSMSLFIRPLELDFGWQRGDVALASSFLSYTIMLISPLQGYLVDRFGARRVILPCIPVFALALGSMYFLPPIPWVYYAAWVMLPVMGIGLFPLAYLQVVSTWFSKRLGLALGVANAGIGIGGALLPVIIGWLIAAYGWRMTFVVLGVMVLLLTFPIAWKFARDDRPSLPLKFATGDLQGLEFKAAIRTLQFKILIAVFFILGALNTSVVVHHVPLLTDAGVAMNYAVLALSVYGAAVVVGRIATGFLIDIFPPARVMIIFVLGGSFACTLYALGTSSHLIFLSAALLGLLLGAEFDVLSYILKSDFGLKSFGKLYGVIFASFQFGAGCGATFLSISRQNTGSYSYGLWVLTLVLVVCAGLLLILSLLKAPVRDLPASVAA